MEQIKRMENGAIDTAYYLERSRRLRGQVLWEILGKWLRSPASPKAGKDQSNRPRVAEQATRFPREIGGSGSGASR